MAGAERPWRVDLFASLPHYADHLWPIWLALDDDQRGDSWATHSTWWGSRRRPSYQPPAGTVTLVASWRDALAVAPAPVIYVEHGAGQTYVDLAGHPSYSGGDHGRANVIGYVCPSTTVAARWAGAPACAVGCPKLDRQLVERREPDPRTLVITWHWNAHVNAESRPAWRHYERTIGGQVARWQSQGWQVVGHGHPRSKALMQSWWRDLGVSTCFDAAEVLDHAALLIADNTSLMYEAAALGRRVLALNAPWYRRDVEHGLRFWSHVPGWQIDGPAELASIDLASYVDDDPSAQLRDRAVDHVYAFTDGHSAMRAAQFITATIGDQR